MSRVSASRLVHALAVVASLPFAVAGCGGDLAPLPTVAMARAVRGEFTVTREGQRNAVQRPTRVEEGSEVATGDGGHGMLALDNGSWLFLDAHTRVRPSVAALRFVEGRVFVRAHEGVLTAIHTSVGDLEGKDVSFSLEAEEGGGVRAVCVSGELSYRSEHGEGQLAQGETLRLDASNAKVVPTDLWDDWTGGLAEPLPRVASASSFVGALFGRTIAEWGSAPVPLSVRNYDVVATVLGDFVHTELTQTFFNARSEVLETEYTIRLPEGAIVESFAVDPGTGLKEGVIATMSQGERYALPWQERESATSRLSYDGPGRLRARIFPIQPGAAVRVVLRYGEWLTRRGAMRTYVVPMRSDGPAPLLGELRIHVDTAQAGAGAYRAGMGAKVEAGSVVLRQSDVRPNADFVLDLIDAKKAPPGEIHALVGVDNQAGEHEDAFVLFDLATEDIPYEDVERDQPPLSLVVLVDVSGGTSDEDLELARASVDALLRHLSPTDRIALRLVDVEARPANGAPDSLVAVSEAEREAFVQALAAAQTGGATDLAASLRQAADLLAGEPRGVVLYLGDGLPTTGALTAAEVRSALGTLDDPPRFFALGLGAGVNEGLLRALVGPRFRRAFSAREAAFSAAELLSEMAQPVLRDLAFDLGEDVERVYPAEPFEAPVGGHVQVVGRLRGPLPKHVTVRGRHFGNRFEQALPVVRKSVAERGDIARRWATLRLSDLLDQDAGREALVELGDRFSILTPWTGFETGGGQSFSPVRGFDHDPFGSDWSRSGGTATQVTFGLDDEGGWRRRRPRSGAEPAVALFDGWFSRGDVTGEPTLTGDGGLAAAQVKRALGQATQGPDGCFERKQLLQPDLSGFAEVRLSVGADGAVRDAQVIASTLGAEDVERCIAREVAGLAYPGTGSAVTVTHRFVFSGQLRVMGTMQECSALSRLELFLRRRLWKERLASYPGVQGAMDLYQRARLSCELDSWRAKQALLEMLLAHVGGMDARIALLQAFGPDSEAGRYLKQVIVREVTRPNDILVLQEALGLAAEVDWRVFARDWRKDDSATRRLALVDRWLRAVPDEMDLLLRRLALLEELKRAPEARRLARRLVEHPLCDARVLTEVGEFWLRGDDRTEARRVFSELVERAPFDPWARKRLGDLYRVHGWVEDAYREYQTLARLDPSNGGVRLHLAAAAAGAGRVFEALLLERELGASEEAGAGSGLAEAARLRTAVRLGELLAQGGDIEQRAAVLAQVRQAGILRDPPALLAVFLWSHPDDRPEFFVRYPGRESALPSSSPPFGGNRDDGMERVPVQAGEFGLEAVRIREREPAEYVFTLRRDEKDRLRPLRGQLFLWADPGTADGAIVVREVVLTREQPSVRLRFSAENVLSTDDPSVRPVPGRQATPPKVGAIDVVATPPGRRSTPWNLPEGMGRR